MKFYLECITEYMDDPAWCFFFFLTCCRSELLGRSAYSLPVSHRLRSHLKHQQGSFRLGGGWERGRGREDLGGP